MSVGLKIRSTVVQFHPEAPLTTRQRQDWITVAGCNPVASGLLGSIPRWRTKHKELSMNEGIGVAITREGIGGA